MAHLRDNDRPPIMFYLCFRGRKDRGRGKNYNSNGEREAKWIYFKGFRREVFFLGCFVTPVFLSVVIITREREREIVRKWSIFSSFLFLSLFFNKIEVGCVSGKLPLLKRVKLTNVKNQLLTGVLCFPSKLPSTRFLFPRFFPLELSALAAISMAVQASKAKLPEVLSAKRRSFSKTDKEGYWYRSLDEIRDWC